MPRHFKAMQIVIMLMVALGLSVAMAIGCSLLVDLSQVGETAVDLSNSRMVHMQQVWERRHPDWFAEAWTSGETASDVECFAFGFTFSRLLMMDDKATHSLFEYQSGWPMNCLRGHYWMAVKLVPDPTLPDPNALMIAGRTTHEDQVAMVRPHYLPFGVIDSVKYVPFGVFWPGLLINTLFYALVLAGLWWGLLILRARHRRRHGLCLICAHQLHTSKVCPECGSPQGLDA